MGYKVGWGWTVQKSRMSPILQFAARAEVAIRSISSHARNAGGFIVMVRIGALCWLGILFVSAANADFNEGLAAYLRNDYAAETNNIHNLEMRHR